MATFEYSALTSKGKKIKGQLEGDSARQVRQKLREDGLSPIEVKSVVEQSKVHAGKLFQKKITTADLALSTRQLYTLLSAGMPITNALHAVAKQTEKKSQRQFLITLYQSVSEGHSFAASLRRSNFIVNEDYIATVAAGEESGHLEKVLSRLADAIEKQEKLNKKLKAAMIYPILMVVVAFTIIFFLIVYVVPKVVTVFDNMNQTLPPLTQGLLDLSAIVQEYWSIILLFIVGMIVGYKLLMKNDGWRYKIESFILRIPAVRQFLIYSASARWARTLGVLLDSGVSVMQALKISTEVMTLLPLKKKIIIMNEKVRKGQSISNAMKKAGFFPALLINLAETGEGNGMLDQMLLRGAERYEEDLETSAQTLISILEPVLIIVMGGVVLTIVLAIMLPIFEMNQMIGK